MPVSFRRLKESDKRTLVEFRVKFSTRHGESVHVVGDIPSLGCWEMDQGVPLVTTPESYPYWYTPKPIAVMRNQTIQYKYVVFSGGKFSRWETFDGNRSALVHGLEMLIENDADVATADESIEVADNDSLRTSDDASPQPGDVAAEDRTSRVRFTLPVGESDDLTNAAQQHAARLSPLIVDGDRTLSPHYDGPLANSPAREGHPPRGNLGAPDQLARESERYTRRDEPFELKKGDRVTIVSYFLPVTCRQVSLTNGGTGWEVQWDDNALLSMKPSHIPSDALRVTYVGCPAVSEPLSVDEQDKLAEALSHYRCVPVFVAPRLHYEAYHRYCEGTLKMIFHNIADVFGALPTRYWNRRSHQEAYKAFREVNHQFADKIVEIYHDTDLTWIHGNELLLLPSMLARRLRRQNANIGFYMHTPFPSSELFRTLSVRKDLLHGILGANHIGFHVYDYARHFLTSCRRLLSLETDIEKDGSMSVAIDGRKVIVSVCHAGIEPEFVIGQLYKAPVANNILHNFSQIGNGRIVAVGVDTVERQQGLFLKFLAFEELLETHHELRGKICLVQVGVSASSSGGGIGCPGPFSSIQNPASTTTPKDSNDSSVYEEPPRWREELTIISKRINDRFAGDGPPVVYYEERDSMTLKERVALWAIGDIFLSTPVCAGLDLHPFEFVAVRGEMRKLVKQQFSTNTSSKALQQQINTMIPELETVVQAELSSATNKPSMWADCYPVLVLSEFSAAARVLSGCLRVNPWRRDAVVASLVDAIHLPLAEREARGVKDLTYVCHHVMSEWAERILTRLKRACLDPEQERQLLQGANMESALPPVGGRQSMLGNNSDALQPNMVSGGQVVGTNNVLGEQMKYTGVGLGLAFRAIGFRPDFGHLDLEALSRAYRSSSRRVILLDFGGTLVADEVQESSYGSARTSVLPDLSPSVKSSLLTLVTDPANSVFIVSGKECSALEHAFRNFPQLGFAAEHGFFFSWGKKDSHGVFGRSLTGSRRGAQTLPVPDNTESTPRQWEMIDDHFDDSWMEICRNIMEMYKQRTTGTMIEQKGSTLVWKYSDADPDFGTMQATELRDHLRGVLSGFPVIVSPGKGYVEVRPEVCDKGKAAEHVIATVTAVGGEPDFVFAIGDDVADERTFEYLKKYVDNKTPPRSPRASPQRRPGLPKIFTCVVGKKPSSARAYVNDVTEVEQLLATLSKVSRTKNLSKSLSDIRDMLVSGRAFDDDSQGYDSGPMEDDIDDSSSAGVGMDDSSIGNQSGSLSSMGGRSPPLRSSGMRYSFSVPSLHSLAHPVQLPSVQDYLQNIEEDTESEDGMGIQF